jgi:hypothetical protein
VDTATSRKPRRPVQMSLAFMLLMMVIFAMLSAGLFYASRVPAVQEELAILLGTEVRAEEGRRGRLAQVGFILFTFTSPLLLAGFLATCMGVLRWVEEHR